MHSFPVLKSRNILIHNVKAQSFKMKTLSFKMKKEERECTRSLWMWNHSGKEQKCTHSGMNVKAHFCTNELKHWCKMRIEWKKDKEMHSLGEKTKQCTHFFQYGEQSRVVFPFLKRQKLFVNGTQSYNSFEWNAKLLNNRCRCETYSNPF